MKYKIRKNGEDYDHDSVEFVGGKYSGYGFIGRGKKKIALEKCPECGLENYCMAVLDGVCAWCGFDANKE